MLSDFKMSLSTESGSAQFPKIITEFMIEMRIILSF